MMMFCDLLGCILNLPITFENKVNLQKELAAINTQSLKIAQHSKQITEAVQINNELVSDLQARVKRLQVFVNEME